MQAAARAAAGAVAGGEQRLVLEEAAVGDRVVDPGQVLLDDRPGAEVEVADLGVAHLAVGQADVAALGGELSVREPAPEAVEDRRLGQRDRVPRPRLGEPPAVEDDQGEGGDELMPAFSTIAAKSPGSRLAPPTRAPSMSGLRQQLGGVGGLDRAAVEDAHGVGRAAALAQQVADEGARPPGPARASRCVRCRSPRSARRRSRRQPAPSPSTAAEVGLQLALQHGLGLAAVARLLALADAEDRLQARRRARPGPCGPMPRRSRRSAGGARSGRGRPPRRRARPASPPRPRR